MVEDQTAHLNPGFQILVVQSVGSDVRSCDHPVFLFLLLCLEKQPNQSINHDISFLFIFPTDRSINGWIRAAVIILKGHMGSRHTELWFLVWGSNWNPFFPHGASFSCCRWSYITFSMCAAIDLEVMGFPPPLLLSSSPLTVNPSLLLIMEYWSYLSICLCVCLTLSVDFNGIRLKPGQVCVCVFCLSVIIESKRLSL